LHGSASKSGYFVEFGATDGLSHSNTKLLEDAGWSGILCEPARIWHSNLHANRNQQIDTRCVSTESGHIVVFNETSAAELSTVDSYSDSDHHGPLRTEGIKYEVETISLSDLLNFHNAPTRINYLSIDTEGSEFDILSSFDFTEFEIEFISVEHNFTPNREAILDLLQKQGFKRILTELSEWDDWYINSDLLNLNRRFSNHRELRKLLP
jgi:FkbM family methyltransferase